MLSKSAAKAFFLIGTGISFLAFVGLTYDTFRQIPARTHADQITPEVARGKEIWDHKNCMGCHTIFGEGAYYAPELTKVMERRGEVFVRGMLRDPAAMYPGQRQMVQYDFTDAEIDDLVAFLTWIGHVDTNGFPADPPLRQHLAPAASADGRPLVFQQTCIACHSVGGAGGNVGPALDGVGTRRDADYLTRWLHDPSAVKPEARMPQLGLSDAQVTELVTYLGTLRTEH
ncbi:MAG: c-type cytochrome [Deltaproteobacteria bacterium]|nr:c-type cytochrome [Deltaproteobacteria bacterium]